MEKIRPFGNWSPRLSVTYNMFGNGKTALKGSVSYYYKTRETLADNLSGLFTGDEADVRSQRQQRHVHRHVLLDRREHGRRGAGQRAHRRADLIQRAVQHVDRRPRAGRERRGSRHSNREDARSGGGHAARNCSPTSPSGWTTSIGSTTAGWPIYTLGYQPGAPGYPLQQIYTGPLNHTDPISGNTGEYYVVKQGAMRPSGAGSITMTNPNYQIYHGVDFTVTKRYSDKWQVNAALTVQTNPQYFPDGNVDFTNPTGEVYQDGISTIAKYVLKVKRQPTTCRGTSWWRATSTCSRAPRGR